MSWDQKVEFHSLMRTTPERAYDAIATSKGLDAWFTTGAFVDVQDLLNRATGWGCVLTLMKFYLEHGVTY